MLDQILVTYMYCDGYCDGCDIYCHGCVCDGGMCGIYCDACVIYIVRIYVNCLSVTIM